MQNLVEFFEMETNKQINLFKYTNQSLKENQQLISFNNETYIIEMNDKFVFNHINGYFYLIHQQNLDFENLKRVLDNLYEDINVFEYNKFVVLNSSEVLEIDLHTPEIIESETYSNTIIAYLGRVSDIDIFNLRLSIFNDILPLLSTDSNLNKYITLTDLTIFNVISLITKEKSLNSLIDLENINSIDKNLLHTGISFIENDLNISKTSAVLFLHRNTLIYRLEKIKEIFGLDLKTFKDAFVFYLSIKSYFASNI